MAITLTLTHPVTDEELIKLSERNPGYQFERTARGEVIVTPTGSESSRASGEVFGQLRDWNRRSGRGVVFDSSGGFRLPDSAVRAPDASWVRQDRWEGLTREQRRTFAPLCPDAVFEIRSESQSLTELRAKMSDFIASGTQIAVLIDLDMRILEVYRPEREPEVYQDPKTVALAPELPGFILDLGPVYTT
jgi:Uma2 family endonuclease